ncbi:hypothetical protein MIND_00829000 [Mycena indigotica]|uniref:F-box domain-containing protein n=1 Tax=Mycena indigotica TaxID=2126181 RepID=A0A8H6VYG9_9AGAR|nr:uncharacterized protein MIND_00829000 [Mycena indigotica]KAF7298814.1 hypothetical protein MIND_00829000 [Mycena indigotica]
MPKPPKTKPLAPLSIDLAARVPPELHDYVIDFLHDHRPSMCSCSLVCKAWLSSSRYHLFRNSTLRVTRWNFEKFLHFSSANGIHEHIGRLDLESHIIDEVFHHSEPTLQFNNDLKRFVNLPAVHYLRLHYHHDVFASTIGKAITENFGNIKELEFSSVHIDSFGTILEICQTLPSLRRLALCGLLLIGDEEDSREVLMAKVAAYPNLPNLTDFVFEAHRGNENVLRWLSAQRGLRLLAISRLATRAERSVFAEIIKAVGPQLTHLFLGPTNAAVDLITATNLQTLELRNITIAAPGTESVVNYVFPTLSSLLGRRAPPATLRTLVLNINVEFQTDIDTIQWDEIAPLLASADSLRRVDVGVSRHKKSLQGVICDQKLPAPRPYSIRVSDSDPKRNRFSLVNCSSTSA